MDERSQWYTNRDLFEMVQGLRQDVGELRTEMAATRESIRRYNGLRERIEAIEQRAIGRASAGQAIREWGGWLVGIAALLLSFWRAIQ